jgi:hypothetical protein
MVWYQVEPQAVDRLVLRIHLCVPPAVAEDPSRAADIAQLRSLVDAIHQEDIRACAGVQAGLASRYARAGRLSHLEKALWQFHRFLAARLGEGREGASWVASLERGGIG